MMQARSPWAAPTSGARPLIPDPDEVCVSASPLLEAHDIQKRFGNVVALRSANFDLYRGEVHAIVGDNGAGKSTLIKIISGVLQPDGGELLIEGQPVGLHS